MVKHRLLDGLFLLNGLLLQAKELLLGVLLQCQCVLVARPDLMTLLDAVLAVLTVVLVVSLQRLNHVANNILRGILHHPRQNIDTGPHSRDSNRKCGKFELAGLTSLPNVIGRAHDMEHVPLKLIRILFETFCEILYKLVVANCKVL